MEQTVVIGSTNPVKIGSVRKAFQDIFPDRQWNFQAHNSASGVAEQPMGDEETYRGAVNRAENARMARPDADFWVGIEGGVADSDEFMEAFAWVVVISSKKVARSKTATFLLPESVAELVRQGLELGLADDRVFGRSNSKEKDGAVGLLTGGVIDRTNYYSHAVTLALIPFYRQEHFTKFIP